MAARNYRDYFKILGLERTADSASIKQAFRKLARKYHPDTNSGDVNSEEKFKEINEAYEVLSDKDKRKRYEQYGEYWDQLGNLGGRSQNTTNFDVDFGRYGTFDEFINDLLGKFAGAQGVGGVSSTKGFPRSVNRTNVNLDAEIKLQINFLEAFKGTERTLAVNEERVLVRIPKGIRSGAKLRVKGKGNLQPGTGLRGDLYLLLEVLPHDIWKLDANQLHADLPVTFDELVLGAEVTVVTPDGPALLVIPAGTQAGKSLRLKGKGWPLGSRRGDLIFTLILNLPEDLSEEELNLLKQLKKLRKDKPRLSWIEAASF